MFFGRKDPYRKLKRQIGDHKVFDRREDLMVYAQDASYTTPPGNHDPEIVILAENTNDVIAAVNYARNHEMHVVPRGMGSGMSAGAVPMGGGMVIVTERMKKIIDFNPGQKWIQCEPGLSNEDVKKAAAKHKLFYPPDPSSFKISSIGGNIAENAGGLRCVKYGTTKDYISGLKFVDVNGEVISTGTLNNGKQSLDLTPLIVGSEGLFGIVTEARLSLLPAPEATYTLLAHFETYEQSLDAIHIILAELIPSVCEFMDGSVIEAIRQNDPYPFPENTGAVLLIETDGPADHALAESQRVQEILAEYGALEVHSASNPFERERLWNLRRLISPSLARIKDGRMNEDVVVPLGKMGELINFVKNISENTGILIPLYGHAGDGNIHVTVMYDKADNQEARVAHEVVEKCFRQVIQLGGSITGEHGVGASKNRYMHLQFTDLEIEIFRNLKKAFDPDGLFNPHKVFPPGVK